MLLSRISGGFFFPLKDLNLPAMRSASALSSTSFANRACAGVKVALFVTSLPPTRLLLLMCTR
jgi:hypothetical protein